MLATYYLRNPVYGCVGIWASYAIYTRELPNSNGAYYQNVRVNAIVIIVI